MSEFLTLQSSIVLVGAIIGNAVLAAIWMNWVAVGSYFNKLPPYLPALISLGFFILWVFVFFVYRFPVSGDVASFFIPQGEKALSGLIPNRDFQSSYMLLFPYLMGLVYSIWPSDYAIGFFFLICWIVFSFLFYDYLKRFYDVSASALYLIVGMLNSAIWILGIAYQQDEAMLILFLLLLLTVSLRKLDFWAGFLAGLAFLTSKLTFVLFWIPLFFASGNKKVWVSGLFISVAPVLALFFWLGFSPLWMISGEGVAIDPPSVVNSLRFFPLLYRFFSTQSILTYGLAFVLILIVIWTLFRLHRPLSTIKQAYSFVIIWLVFLLFSLKSLPTYRLLIIPFVPLVLEPYRTKIPSIPIIFSAYTLLVSVYTMFYEDWHFISKFFDQLTVISGTQRIQYGILSLAEFFILFCEVAIVFLAFKLLNQLDGAAL